MSEPPIPALQPGVNQPDAAPDVADLFRPRFDRRFIKAMGIRLERWLPGLCELSLALGEQHLNNVGVVHGGVLVSLIDTACSLAATYAPSLEDRHGCVSIGLTSQFLASPKGRVLRAVGRRKGGGRKLCVCHAEIFDEDGTLVAYGDVTCKILAPRAPT